MSGKKIITFLMMALLAFIPARAYCGDYQLTISDDPQSDCTAKARSIHAFCEKERLQGRVCFSEESWPVHTSDEVIESLTLYFSGEEPKIKILLAAFSNGHISFCSKKERVNVQKALMHIKASGSGKNKTHLDDFIRIISPVVK